MDQRPERDCEAELDCLRSTYLDLIGESLVGRLNRDPPMGKAERSYDDMHRENGWDWPSGAPSMIGAKRMRNLRNECERVIREGVPGDFMETGVWRGGACIMMRAVLKAHGIAGRRVISNLHDFSEFSVSLDEVKSAFYRYGLLDSQVVFLEGLFKDTLPTAPVQQLAVLRLDGDMYESTMDGLVNLYEKLSPGGSLIVDDYFLFEAHRQAVDEYRASFEIADPIVRIDEYGGFWIKDLRHTRR